MLGSAAPATASTHTNTSTAVGATSPTRPSRLRGLSYLRTYTHNHLHSISSTNSSRAETPPLTRSVTSPIGSPPPPQDSERTTIQSGEHGWLPTLQGRTSALTSTFTETASPEPSNTVTMTRSRAGTTGSALPNVASPSTTVEPTSVNDTDALTAPTSSSSQKDPSPTIRFIPHVEARSARPSLQFSALSRTLKTPSTVVRVGRYSERDINFPDPEVLPIGFKSKVVSRRHCEFWCTDGQWYVKDVKSSSGTFLNHVRLSSPGAESRPFPVNDGDVVQLGIDFKGGEEIIFRCVKIRIECNRGWQKSLNNFNTSAHKRLLKNARQKSHRDSDAASTNSSECSICLNPVAPCQALFVAPCSHVWHYKCVRNLITGPNWPNFICPNCRFVADLEADVEPPEEDEFEDFEDFEDDDKVESQGESSANERAATTDDDGPAGAAVDEELASMMDQTSLEPETPASPPAAQTNVQNTTGESTPTPPQTSVSSPHGENTSTATSQPVPIARRTPSGSAGPNADRATTPDSTGLFASLNPNDGTLGAGPDMNILENGPLTPRNDAGPFVLDGSAGRVRQGRIEGIAGVDGILSEAGRNDQSSEERD